MQFGVGYFYSSAPNLFAVPLCIVKQYFIATPSLRMPSRMCTAILPLFSIGVLKTELQGNLQSAGKALWDGILSSSWLKSTMQKGGVLSSNCVYYCFIVIIILGEVLNSIPTMRNRKQCFKIEGNLCTSKNEET